MTWPAGALISARGMAFDALLTLGDASQAVNEEAETRQERRERRKTRKREKVPQHGKSLSRVYRDAILKRLKKIGK